MAVLAALGLVEFFAMTARARPFQLVAIAASTGMIVAAHFGDSFHIVLAGVAFFPVMFMFAMVRRESLHGVTWSMAITVFGLIWIALPFAHAVLLRDLPLHGGALLVDVLVATIVTDTFAYIGGRMFGRRPLAPSISPNKTIEGLAVGFVAGNARLLVRRPLSGLAERHRRAADGTRDRCAGADRRPLRVSPQA